MMQRTLITGVVSRQGMAGGQGLLAGLPLHPAGAMWVRGAWGRRRESARIVFW